jgi:glycosyltransferase involved in cell wall biosynthesis
VNIGIVTTWFERGAAYVSRAYRDALVPQHRVFIFARAGEKTGCGDPVWDQPDITRGTSLAGKIDTYIDPAEFRGWVARYAIEAVIFNEQHSWDIILAARKMPLAIGAYVDYYTPDTIPFFGLYDFLLCNTQRHYSVFKTHPQCLFIPWGTDLQVFHPRPAVRSFTGVTFFHSSGLSPFRKGTDILIRAFQCVRGPARLVIHSQDIERRDRPSAWDLVQAAHDPRIELVEAEVGAPGLYERGDVYVYPSRLEGIGLTIVEALASGLPVITTDAPPMNEFVTEGMNGKLVKVAEEPRRADNYYWPESLVDEAALVEAMQWYVEHPESLRDFKSRSRADAEARFDWRKNARPLTDWLPWRENRALETAAAEYEQWRYGPPKPGWRGRVLNLLRKTGAGRVKRAIQRAIHKVCTCAF